MSLQVYCAYHTCYLQACACDNGWKGSHARRVLGGLVLHLTVAQFRVHRTAAVAAHLASVA
eukprot:scaffold4683_cov112-Cylindrotheca_fusiformis.AAC.6